MRNLKKDKQRVKKSIIKHLQRLQHPLPRLSNCKKSFNIKLMLDRFLYLSAPYAFNRNLCSIMCHQIMTLHKCHKNRCCKNNLMMEIYRLMIIFCSFLIELFLLE